MGGSWLVLLACGGAYTRGGTDENLGGAGSGGSASKPSNGGRSSSGSAGAAKGIAGSATMTPTPTPTPTPNPDPAPCFNDTDCPNSSCGGQVCNWAKIHPNPVGDKTFVCDPPGLAPKGADGWCTTDGNCKCHALGAQCFTPYCSFTKPSDAPGR